jgi:hypothetical protein
LEQVQQRQQWVQQEQEFQWQQQFQWQQKLQPLQQCPWCHVCHGLHHAIPTSWPEILRQPFFGNSHLQTPQELTLGTASDTYFNLYAHCGFNCISDI